ncbi:MAG: hypothetical protein AABZ31_15535 [Bdellovibrionota bacterium]
MKRWIRSTIQLWLFALCSTLTISVHAAVIDMNVFYFTDTTSGETDSSHSVTAYAFYFGFSIDKKGRYVAGWNYASYTTATEDDATTIDYSSTQMGPAFIIYLDRDHNWRLGLAYNLETNATYERTGAAEEEWRGTGIAADIGYQFYFSEMFSLGARLNYQQSSYSETVTDTTKEDVSYSKDLIYPSMGLSFTF